MKQYFACWLIALGIYVALTLGMQQGFAAIDHYSAKQLCLAAAIADQQTPECK